MLPRMFPRWLLLLCLGWPCLGAASAAELLPPETPIPRAIDHYIGAALADQQIPAAPPVGDAAFLRRVTLDLAGRIPTLAELDDYERQSPSDKRERLVERLLSSPDFAWHQRNEWDVMLLGDKESSAEWRDYLLAAVRENRPWDQIFTDVLSAKEDDRERRGALQFLKARGRDLDTMTNDTSVLFFGVNVACAKCHDHPLVDDWKQDHYYGLSAFFARTYLTKSRRLAEKGTAEVKFKTTQGVEKTARLMFLSGAVAEEVPVAWTDEQRKAEEEEVRRQQKEDNAPPPPPPAFSPRMELVALALRPENRRFLARNAVNRLWARLFGRGLVHPLDQMHSGNSPSHPELMDWLERDFVAHGYDVRRLLRGMVLSETYARSSAWTENGPTPPPESFAFMAVRPLTPKQLSLSLAVATTSPRQWADGESSQWIAQRQNLEAQAQGFAGLIEQPGEHFQVSVTEALLFANGERVQNEFLRDGTDRLVHLLRQEPDESAAITRAFRTVLSRDPDAEERFTVETYLSQRRDRPAAAWQQVIWALATSPEFRFNH
uniref:DUF1549 domain-containing protein n=1 Tax=Schlesneria paludicola TaxID=360056 RepID=A0A7C4LKV1_9PLAN